MSVTSRFLSTHPRLVLGIAIVLASVASSELIMAQDAPAATPDDVGYFLGMSVGQQLAQQGFQAADFTAAGLTKGLTDALAGGGTDNVTVLVVAGVRTH